MGGADTVVHRPRRERPLVADRALRPPDRVVQLRRRPVPAPAVPALQAVVRPHPRRFAHALAAIAVVTGTATLSVGWLGVGDAATGLMLHVHDVAANVAGSTFRVQATIGNVDDVERWGEVRFVLSPVHTREAWVDRVYVSASRVLHVDAGDEIVLDWIEPVAVPAGSYRVTIFSRAERDGRLVPAGESRAAEPVSVARAADDGSLLRSGPAGAVAAAAVGVTLLPGGGLAIDATLANRGSTARSATVRWSLVEVPIGSEASWWRQPTRVVGGEQRAVLEPSTEGVVSFAAPTPPVTGRFLVRLDVVGGGAILDSAVAPTAVALADPLAGWSRGGAVVGPVLVSSVAVTRPGEPVSVGLANLSDVDQVVRCFWLLAEPGRAEPWRATLVASEPVVVAIAAGEIAFVELPGVPTALQYRPAEMVVGVHRGGDLHSDWVRAEADGAAGGAPR